MGCCAGCASKQSRITTDDFQDMPLSLAPEVTYHVLGLDDMNAAIRCITRSFSGNANAESDDYVPAEQGVPGEQLQNWIVGGGDVKVALEDKIAYHEYCAKFAFLSAYHLKGVVLGMKYTGSWERKTDPATGRVTFVNADTGEVSLEVPQPLLASVAVLFPHDSPFNTSPVCAGLLALNFIFKHMGGAMPPSDPKKYGQFAGKRGSAVENCLGEMYQFRSNKTKGRYYKIEVLAVDPKFQGKGIAGEAMKVIQWLADRDNMPLYVECAGDRLPNMYKKMGFSEGETVAEPKLSKDDPGPSVKVTGLLRKAKTSVPSDARKVAPNETE